MHPPRLPAVVPRTAHMTRLRATPPGWLLSLETSLPDVTTMTDADLEQLRRVVLDEQEAA